MLGWRQKGDRPRRPHIPPRQRTADTGHRDGRRLPDRRLDTTIGLRTPRPAGYRPATVGDGRGLDERNRTAAGQPDGRAADSRHLQSSRSLPYPPPQTTRATLIRTAAVDIASTGGYGGHHRTDTPNGDTWPVDTAPRAGCGSLRPSGAASGPDRGSGHTCRPPPVCGSLAPDTQGSGSMAAWPPSTTTTEPFRYELDLATQTGDRDDARLAALARRWSLTRPVGRLRSAPGPRPAGREGGPGAALAPAPVIASRRPRRRTRRWGSPPRRPARRRR